MASKYSFTILIFLALFAIAMVPVKLVAQGGSNQLDASKLKEMTKNLGYELTDLNTEVGKEKFSFVIKTTGFNIPVGAEISPSKNYIWLTVNLGDYKALSNLSDRTLNMLKENGNIQPSFFYITKSDRLMMAAPIDNRGVEPAVLKRIIDKLTQDVDKTATVWNK